MHSKMLGHKWEWRGLEFRPITVGDISDFEKMLTTQQVSPEDFTRNVLSHQLVNTELVNKIQTIVTNELIDLSNRFISHEVTLQEGLTDTGNVFDDIKNAIAKTIDAISTISKKILRAQGELQQTLQRYQEPVKQMQDAISASLHSEAMKKFSEDMVRTKELLQPMFDEWQKHALSIQEVFSELSKALKPKNRDFLLQNGWIISPFLLQNRFEVQFKSEEVFKLKNSQLNTIYINFFINNDFHELEQMILSWLKEPRFKERVSLFIDCLAIIKTFKHAGKNHKKNKLGKQINPDRIVLPILIAQIDGITTEYAKENGLIPRGVQWINRSGEIIKEGKFKCLWDTPLTNNWGISAIELLENYLFGTAYTSGQQEPKKKRENARRPKFRPFFQFSRHKIMHGEKLRFGSIDNVIRAFLLLDFLAHLK